MELMTNADNSYSGSTITDVKTHPKANTASRGRYVRCEVFTAVTVKNVAFWDEMPCGSC
jgi:hypothetical protein